MKSIFKTIFILLTTIIIAYICQSCKKDPQISDSVLVGQIEGVNISSIDTTIGFYQAMMYGNQYIELDLNKDGIYDLKLSGLQQYWHGPTDYYTRITCLHEEITLMTHTLIDTIFLHIDSIYHYEGDTTICTSYYRYSCSPYSDNDSISSFLNSTLILALDDGDLIDSNQEWNNGNFDMRRYDFPIGAALPMYLYSSNDTAYYKGISNNNYCHNLPQEEILYIGFKINASQTDYTRYGWLKLELSENYKIHLMEYAITK